MSVTAIIADDEPLLRHHLKRELADVWPQLDVLASAENGAQALELIAQLQPQIAFLDIRMPGLDGVSLARQLSRQTSAPLVVFVTAYDEYALAAFEANAVDYLLKPLCQERLLQCVQKLQSRLQSGDVGVPLQLASLLEKIEHVSRDVSPQYLQWIKASKGDEIHLIAATDVLYLKAEDKYVTLVTLHDSFLLRTSLRELLTQLDPQQFWQIHRSTGVNVSAIDKVKKDFSGKMHVYIGDAKLSVSRAMQALFHQN